MRLAIAIHGLDALRAKLGPDLYAHGVRIVLEGAALTAERAARAGAPKDTGALARSIATEITATAARVWTPYTYAAAMEEGRRPGAAMPPPRALIPWMRRHGMHGSPFVLARAIGRRGIRGRFFMRAGKEKAQRAIPALIRAAVRQIERKWGA